jgi:hypothetical protein
MSNATKPYWFPAKTYGWGWGLPSCWQGWLVLMAYLAGVALASLLLPPQVEPTKFTLAISALSGALLLVCLKTGEPPRWRWGSR